MQVEILSLLWEYLIEEAYGVVIALWIIGFALKKTPGMKNWLIVYVLIFLGVLLTIWMLGFTPESLLQGIAAAGIAVLGHQAIKQVKEKFN